jgi:hypothetical protein
MFFFESLMVSITILNPRDPVSDAPGINVDRDSRRDCHQTINPGDRKGRFILMDVKFRYISFGPMRGVPVASIRGMKKQSAGAL